MTSAAMLCFKLVAVTQQLALATREDIYKEGHHVVTTNLLLLLAAIMPLPQGIRAMVPAVE
jgi:hypothetical protein